MDRLTILSAALACLAVLSLGRLPGGGQVEAAAWLILIGAVLTRPPAALIALVVGCLLAARTFPTGTQTDLPLSLVLIVLVAALWIGESVADRRMAELRDPIAALVVALCLTATLSFALANTAFYPPIARAPLRAQLGGLFTFWASGVAMLAAQRWARAPRSLATVHWIFLWLAAAYLVTQIVPELYHSVRHFAGSARGSVICTWAVALAFSQAAFNRDLDAAQRLALWMLAAAFLYLGIGLNRAWLAGWVPALAVLGMIALRKRPVLTLALATAAGAVALWNLDRAYDFVSVGDNAYSLSTRLDAAVILLRIAALQPIFGIGPANYYPATVAYEIRGYAVQFSSHNNYLDVLAQTGVVGLALFLAILGLALRRAWLLAGTAPPGFPRAFALGALGGLAGTLVCALLGDWVIPFVYNQTLSQLGSSTFAWIFLGCLIALRPGTETPNGVGRPIGVVSAAPRKIPPTTPRQ